MHLVVVPFNIISEPLKALYFARYSDQLAEVLEFSVQRNLLYSISSFGEFFFGLFSEFCCCFQ